MLDGVIELIVIHHPALNGADGNVAQARVPRSTFEHGLKAKGWVEGPSPQLGESKPAAKPAAKRKTSGGK